LKNHTDRKYEEELVQLRAKLLFMGSKVEEALGHAMKAFQAQDLPLASRVIRMDRDVNRLEKEVDGDCLSILARRQPVASDLRFITSALKLVTDLERIGDLAVNIAERVVLLGEDPRRRPWSGVEAMAATVRDMLRDALDAFVHADLAKAGWVIEQDRGVDAAYGATLHETLALMMEDRGALQQAMAVQSIAKLLERVGDHATNLAERVVFMADGTDIRHGGGAEREEPEA
jgi:phosphate transport system protein